MVEAAWIHHQTVVKLAPRKAARLRMLNRHSTRFNHLAACVGVKCRTMPQAADGVPSDSQHPRRTP